MQGEFKQCANGHYYQGLKCPYCRSGKQEGNATSLKTEVFVDAGSNTESETYVSGNSYGGEKTASTIGHETSIIRESDIRTAYDTSNRTVFGDPEIESSNPHMDNAAKNPQRYGRKLVGWLVTYSHDELGVDYKIFEGRNIIGRDLDCSISINDGRISGKHAVLLFRANKYSITDSQSSHGTFVNDEDIELEPRYLKDGDLIRMGNTILRFRSSL